jgi:hypothetical protein
VTATRAVLRQMLFATVVLATAAASPPADSGTPLHGSGCAPAVCALEPPTPAELHAIVADADRLLARYTDDPTPLGRECRALGAMMRSRVGEVRMLPVMWRAVDSNGNLAAVTGDAHRVEPTAGAGRVHIARGFDALNPDRGLAAIVETARHEFAHLNGLGQGPSWDYDPGGQLATACGASDASDERRPTAVDSAR